MSAKECDAMKVEVACSVKSRLRGLLGRDAFEGVLLLVPCNDVHTFGMRRAIDVAFISSDGVVLRSCRCVGAHRRLRCKAAYATLERIAAQAEWPDEGDCVNLKEMLRTAMGKKARNLP